MNTLYFLSHLYISVIIFFKVFTYFLHCFIVRVNQSNFVWYLKGDNSFFLDTIIFNSFGDHTRRVKVITVLIPKEFFLFHFSLSIPPTFWGLKDKGVFMNTILRYIQTLYEKIICFH